ncbi:class I SAM-dependent methyltransferase [Pseudonocardia nigra]|uniref:class I SAM-dependent methyltransferase n=1 Tax=Pseudonocardia nigra TaxID=1921578 RepID=UPI001C5CF6D5|nr:class I SAM-dependent methyltransferase [Pseudonocardia nigra]
MWKPRLPAALWWDHNAHYHPWLLRRLPARSHRALDVGCGAGALARRLAARADRVDAVDAAPVMIERARAASGPTTAVRWLVGDVLADDLPLQAGAYDVVTAVASLHHMPLRPALSRLADLVRPGGTLAVVGLYRQTTLADRAVEVLALPANAAVGAVHLSRGRGRLADEDMPVQDATTTLADLRAAAADVVPGARLRRRLFWRYTLVWRRPAA